MLVQPVAGALSPIAVRVLAFVLAVAVVSLIAHLPRGRRPASLLPPPPTRREPA